MDEPASASSWLCLHYCLQQFTSEQLSPSGVFPVRHVSSLLSLIHHLMLGVISCSHVPDAAQVATFLTKSHSDPGSWPLYPPVIHEKTEV